MKQLITLEMFRDAFVKADRKDSFSYKGLEALYNFLEDDNSDYELDVIELCTEWSEIKIEDLEEETGCDSVDQLTYKTTVLTVDGKTVVYANF